MEIINIRIHSKDGSLIEMYPCPIGCIGFDLEPYQRFLAWAIRHSDASGNVQLHENAYDTIMELTQWDDLPCPSGFVIEYQFDTVAYRLLLPYNIKTHFAIIQKKDNE